MTSKRYRVNGSELFNLQSMYEHLMVAKEEMEAGEKPLDEYDFVMGRIEEIEILLEKAHCIGALVDWPTLKRIREIKEERQMIRYNRCLESGSTERDAGFSFQL